jgi:hypothetical protein
MTPISDGDVSVMLDDSVSQSDAFSSRVVYSSSPELSVSATAKSLSAMATVNSEYERSIRATSIRESRELLIAIDFKSLEF